MPSSPTRDTYTLEQAEEDISTLRGQVQMLSEILSMSNSGFVPNTPDAGVTALYSTSNGTPTFLSDSGLVCNIAGSDVLTEDRTVTSTSSQQLSSQWTIPGNDADTDTCYRLSCGGKGTWGSTTQRANFVFQFGGAQIQTMGVADTTFSANTSFVWEYRQHLVVSSAGASGAFINQMWASVGASTVGSQVNGPNLAREGTGHTINTTVDNPYQVNFYWEAGPTGSTITCNWSLFERLGS